MTLQSLHHMKSCLSSIRVSWLGAHKVLLYVESDLISSKQDYINIYNRHFSNGYNHIFKLCCAYIMLFSLGIDNETSLGPERFRNEIRNLRSPNLDGATVEERKISKDMRRFYNRMELIESHDLFVFRFSVFVFLSFLIFSESLKNIFDNLFLN